MNVMKPRHMGHWTKFDKSQLHLRSTHGRAYPFELRMQKGDLTNPNSFKCTDDLYEEISQNLDLGLRLY